MPGREEGFRQKPKITGAEIAPQSIGLEHLTPGLFSQISLISSHGHQGGMDGKKITFEALAEMARLRGKVGTFTRNVATTGSQSVTEVGFQPRAVIIFARGDGGTTNPIDNCTSWGSTDGTNQHSICYRTNVLTAENYAYLISMYDGGGHLGYATIASLDVDGFTITWAKVGTPTGTANCMYLALR